MGRGTVARIGQDAGSIGRTLIVKIEASIRIEPTSELARSRVKPALCRRPITLPALRIIVSSRIEAPVRRYAAMNGRAIDESFEHEFALRHEYLFQSQRNVESKAVGTWLLLRIGDVHESKRRGEREPSADRFQARNLMTTSTRQRLRSRHDIRRRQGRTEAREFRLDIRRKCTIRIKLARVRIRCRLRVALARIELILHGVIEGIQVIDGQFLDLRKELGLKIGAQRLTRVIREKCPVWVRLVRRGHEEHIARRATSLLQLEFAKRPRRLEKLIRAHSPRRGSTITKRAQVFEVQDGHETIEPIEVKIEERILARGHVRIR